MSVREQFDLKLKTMKEMLLELGTLAEVSLDKAFYALEHEDVDMALRVIEEDQKADDLEEEINDLAIILIARQSPVAIDLRRIIAALKISADVERIADLSVNIAKSVIRMGNREHRIEMEQLPKMRKMVKEMLSSAIQAYVEEDVVLAKKVAETDDDVDRLYAEMVPELMPMSTRFPDEIVQITQLAFIGRYIERIADHTTNIAEEVFYLVKGIRYDLNE
ncbi:phosphate signaling complex protein PhoU [Bacillus tianshenii]|nr:phosphate signaling complex protein PhoU [Bacillus tianshenii]